jgi:hypothetical protein
MLAQFLFLADSVDIEIPPMKVSGWVGYTILTAGVLLFVIVGFLIYGLLKKKRQPDDKD